MFRNKLLDERIDWQIKQLDYEYIEASPVEALYMHEKDSATNEPQLTH